MLLLPDLKSDDYYLGISDGVNAIIAAIGGEYKAEKNLMDNSVNFPFILIINFYNNLDNIRKSGGHFLPGGIYRRFKRWVGGSSGWGGAVVWSGGGGFSGGGGSFGGGGASGSW